MEKYGFRTPWLETVRSNHFRGGGCLKGEPQPPQPINNAYIYIYLYMSLSFRLDTYSLFY